MFASTLRVQAKAKALAFGPVVQGIEGLRLSSKGCLTFHMLSMATQDFCNLHIIHTKLLDSQC